MSLSNCFISLNKGKPVFSEAEMKEIRAIANQNIGNMSVEQAEKFAVKTMLDEAIAERHDVLALVHDAMGLPAPAKTAKSESANPAAENQSRFDNQDDSFHYSTGNMGMTSSGSFTSDKSRWITFTREEALSMDSRNIKPAYATKRGIFVGANSGVKLIQPPITPQVDNAYVEQTSGIEGGVIEDFGQNKTNKGTALFSRTTSDLTSETPTTIAQALHDNPNTSKYADILLKRGDEGKKGGIVIAEDIESLPGLFEKKTGVELGEDVLRSVGDDDLSWLDEHPLLKSASAKEKDLVVKKEWIKANFPKPVPNKFFTQENVNNISNALIAVKNKQLGYDEFNQIVEDNLPLPPENERGSNMVGDVYGGTVKDNLHYHFGEYLEGLGIPYIDILTGKQSQYNKADWSKLSIEKDDTYTNPKGSFYVRTGEYGRVGPYKTEDEARNQYSKQNDGRGMTIGDGGSGSFYIIGGGALNKEPHLYDRIVDEFRKNPTKLLRSVKNDISGRIEEQEADMKFFNMAIDDAQQRQYDQSPEGRRAKFKVVDSGINNPSNPDIRYSKSGKVQALYDPKSGLTFMVANHLSKETAPAVVLHEVVHAVDTPVMRKQAMDLLALRGSKLIPAKMREFLQSVYARMESANVVGDEMESASYIVEQALLLGRQDGFSAMDGTLWEHLANKLGTRVANFVKDWVAKVRAALFKRGVAIKLNVDDMIALAKAGMAQAARDEVDAEGDVILRSNEDQFSKTNIEANREYTNKLESVTRKSGHNFTFTPVRAPKEVSINYPDGRTPRASARLAERIAGIFSKDVIWIKASGDFPIDGVVEPISMPDKIFISVDTPIASHVVMGHELSHHLENDAPEIYKRLTSTLEKIIKNRPDFRVKYALQNALDVDLTREMVGNIMGDSFSHPEFWKDVAKANPLAARSIGDKIMAWLNKLAAKIAGVKGYGSDEIVTDINAARRAVAEAVAQYALSRKGARESDANDLYGEAYRSGGQETVASTPERAKVQTGHFNLNDVAAKKQADVSYKKRRAFTIKDVLKSSFANTGTGQTVESIKTATAKLRSSWHGFKRVIIVQSVDEIPGDLRSRALQASSPIDRNSEGIYDPKTNTVYLVADNIATPDRSIWVAVHEVVGHGGIRMLGGQVEDALNRASKNGFVTKLAKAIADDRGETFNAKTHTDEAIAELAAATITGNVDAILERYGVKVPVGMRSNLSGMISRLIDAIRKFIGMVTGRPLKGVSDGDVLGLIRQMKDAVEGKPQRYDTADVSQEALASRGKQSPESFARMMLEELVAENDPMFIHRISSSNSIDGVMQDIVDGVKYQGEQTREDERAGSGADHRHVFVLPEGKTFYAYETDDGKVWIDVSRLDTGNRGQAIYAAIGNYAYNTHKKFVGDPFGLSENAVIRRTSNMLSSALRFGTTRHLEAAQQQVWGDPENGIEPLDWSGSDIDKVEALIHTFVATMQNLAPSLKGYHYDFNTSEFSDAQGRPVSADAISSNIPRDARAGEKTVRRAILLQSIMDVGGKSIGERSGILEQVLRWGGSSTPGNLDAIFSKSPQKDVLRGNRADDASETLNTSQGNLLVPGAALPPAQPPRQDNLGLSGGQPGNRASWDSPEPTKFDDFVYKLQDKNIDMKRVISKIKAAGSNITENRNPYLQEELFHGRSAKRTQDFVNNELKPMMVEMSARGLNMQEIDEYLHARHAKEANALIAQRDPNMQDGGSGMTNKEADDYFANLPELKRKQLEATAKRVDAIISRTREYYVAYGLVSKNQADEWAAMFKHYVPLMREDHDSGMGIGQGFSIKGKEVKHRTGSTAAVVDIIANIAMQREKAIVRGEKNRVAASLFGLAYLNPNPDFWTAGAIPTERVLNEKTGLVETRADPMFKSRNNVVVAKIKDKSGNIHERAVIFNEHNERAVRMAEALKNLDATQLGGLLGVSAIITRYFSSINTQYNPVFGVTNLVRDVQAAILNLTSTPLAKHKAEVLKNILSAAKGIYLDARAERKGNPASSRWAQLWEEMQNEGGMTGYRDLYRNSEDRAKSIEHELDPHNWVNSKWGKVFTANGVLKVPMTTAQDLASPLFDWLSDYNLMMEGSTRLSIYKTAIDHGLSKQAAASLAKNTTVNFNRKGQSGQQAGALYAFFNAAMQGTARIGETVFDMRDGDVKTLRMSGTGKKIIYGGILLGAMQALALSIAGFDDDEPPEFIKERNLIIPIGGKKYISIPMPLGFHAIPNIGRIATEYAMGGFKKPVDHVVRLISVFAEAFNPIGSAGVSTQTILPTAFDPLGALAENKDWTGKAIYKEDFNSLAPTPGFNRNKDTASAWSKFIAEGVNYATGGTDYTPGAFSPTADQIDYLIGQATGGVGREVSKSAQTVNALFTGEELPTHKIPLVGRFYGNSDNQSSQSSRYYSNLKEINLLEAEWKGRNLDGLPIDKFEKENPKYKLIGVANGTERIVGLLHQRKTKMIKDGASREDIKEVDDRITEVMRTLNDEVKSLEATPTP